MAAAGSLPSSPLDMATEIAIDRVTKETARYVTQGRQMVDQTLHAYVVDDVIGLIQAYIPWFREGADKDFPRLLAEQQPIRSWCRLSSPIGMSSTYDFIATRIIKTMDIGSKKYLVAYELDRTNRDPQREPSPAWGRELRRNQECHNTPLGLMLQEEDSRAICLLDESTGLVKQTVDLGCEVNGKLTIDSDGFVLFCPWNLEQQLLMGSISPQGFTGFRLNREFPQHGPKQTFVVGDSIFLYSPGYDQKAVILKKSGDRQTLPYGIQDIAIHGDELFILGDDETIRIQSLTDSSKQRSIYYSTAWMGNTMLICKSDQILVRLWDMVYIVLGDEKQMLPTADELIYDSKNNKVWIWTSRREKITGYTLTAKAQEKYPELWSYQNSLTLETLPFNNIERDFQFVHVEDGIVYYTGSIQGDEQPKKQMYKGK